MHEAQRNAYRIFVRKELQNILLSTSPCLSVHNSPRNGWRGLNCFWSSDGFLLLVDNFEFFSKTRKIIDASHSSMHVSRNYLIQHLKYLSTTDIAQQYRKRTYKATLRRIYENIVVVEKSKYYVLVCVCVCVCVRLLGRVGFCMRERLRHIVKSSVASLTTPHFSTLSHKWRGFRKKNSENEICALIFHTPLIWNISHSKQISARFCHKCENVFM
jgi:hypothetical protein